MCCASVTRAAVYKHIRRDRVRHQLQGTPRVNNPYKIPLGRPDRVAARSQRQASSTPPMQQGSERHLALRSLVTNRPETSEKPCRKGRVMIFLDGHRQARKTQLRVPPFQGPMSSFAFRYRIRPALSWRCSYPDLLPLREGFGDCWLKCWDRVIFRCHQTLIGRWIPYYGGHCLRFHMTTAKST
jgi:hypothetical protein